MKHITKCQITNILVDRLIFANLFVTICYNNYIVFYANTKSDHRKEKMMPKNLFYRVIIASLALILIFGISANVKAFDKERKGFILGFGAGPGFASYSETIDSLDGEQLFDESTSKFSAFTNFKIGYAPSNKLMVYWISNVAWFSKKDSTTFDESKTIATGVGGLGLTYFLNPQSPSLFVTVGGAFSAWSFPFEGTQPRVGMGFGGGIGYEFSPNWNMELSVLFGSPKEESESERLKYSHSTFAVGMTISVLGY